jgi:FkbM family methyltransferase
MKTINAILERTALIVVSVLPLKVLMVLLRHLPSSTMAKLISSFRQLQIYKISLFGQEFFIESGPRDDHYLDLKKDSLRTWEHNVLSMWAKEISKAELAVDIGAYFGVYSILAAKLGCKKVLAVEPNQSNFNQLQRNLSLNEEAKSVECHLIAVGAESKRVSMLTPIGRPNSSGSQISDSPTGRELDDWEIESEVNMVTLDSLLVNETARVSTIKIDAEGYELFILQGATETLISYGPSILIELLDTDKKKEADIFLKQFGYSPGLPLETLEACTNFFYPRP